MAKVGAILLGVIVGIALGVVLQRPAVETERRKTEAAQAEARKQKQAAEEESLVAAQTLHEAREKILQLQEDKKALTVTIGEMRENWDTVAIPRDILKRSSVWLPDSHEWRNAAPPRWLPACCERTGRTIQQVPESASGGIVL